MGSDYECTKLTCNNASTDDYFLSASSVFQNIVDLKVQEFSHLLSDVHCPISLTVKTKFCTNNDANSLYSRGGMNTFGNSLDITTNDIHIKLWSGDKEDLFVRNIDTPKVAEIE